MSAIPYQHAPDTGWAEEEPLALPGGRRRRRWGRPAALLLALITATAGFYAGIRLEKHQLDDLIDGRAPVNVRRPNKHVRLRIKQHRRLHCPWRDRQPQHVDRDDRERRRQHDLHHRDVGQHDRGHALVRDQDHQKPRRLKKFAATGRLDRHPRHDELDRHDRRHFRQRLWRQRHPQHRQRQLDRRQRQLRSASSAVSSLFGSSTGG